MTRWRVRAWTAGRIARPSSGRCDWTRVADGGVSSQNRVDPFQIRPGSGLGGRWPITWRPGTSVEGGTWFWPSSFPLHPILAIALISWYRYSISWDITRYDTSTYGIYSLNFEDWYQAIVSRRNISRYRTLASTTQAGKAITRIGEDAHKKGKPNTDHRPTTVASLFCVPLKSRAIGRPRVYKRVCVLQKLCFLLVGIQHTQCPCWFFLLERRKLCSHKMTTQRYYIVMQ